MTETDRVTAPSVEEIERRFRGLPARATRPVVLGGLTALGVVCRYRWTAEGATNLLAHDGPLIFAANHCSHADTAAIMGTLPRPLRDCTCVAAALDVFGPASRHGGPLRAMRRECLQTIVAAGFHAFAFDRHGPPMRSLRTAVTLVRRGWSLLLYPEGTRSRTGELGPFKSGVGVLAKMTGRPVVPVHVDGGPTILPCGATIPRAGHAVVRYGEPVRYEADEDSQHFTDRLRALVLDLGSRRRETAAPLDDGEDLAVGSSARLAKR